MVKQLEVNGDQVIVGRNGTALVSSKSEPGAWHAIKNGACDCKGYQYRGRCRHVGAVATAATQPAPIVNATFALYAQTLAGGFGGHRGARNGTTRLSMTAKRSTLPSGASGARVSGSSPGRLCTGPDSGRGGA